MTWESGTWYRFCHDDMNRIYFVGIFFCGAGFAFVVVFVSEYFKLQSVVLHPRKHKPFTPLPEKNEIRLVDEGTIAVVLPHLELQETKNVKGTVIICKYKSNSKALDFEKSLKVSNFKDFKSRFTFLESS